MEITEKVAFNIASEASFVYILVTLFYLKFQVFRYILAKMDHIWPGIINEFDVNVARFARNVECDFFCDFQTLCPGSLYPIELAEDIWPSKVILTLKGL